MRTFEINGKTLTGWNDHIWVPEGWVSSSTPTPAEVCYDADQWRAIVDKYDPVFAANPDIWRIATRDPLDFVLLEVTDCDGGDDVCEFDWQENGWVLASLTIARYRSGWISFHQKHASDIEMEVFLIT